MPDLRPSSGIGRWVKDPYCGLSHAAGALAAAVGIALALVYTTGGLFSYVGLGVYGASMVALFTASAVAHSVHVSESVGRRLDRLDYACIFFLIAGTYTPLCLSAIRGPWGYAVLAAEAGLAAVGIGAVLLTRVPVRWITPVYVPMGWLVLAAAVPLARAIPTAAMALLVAGGVIYSVGAAVFMAERPTLWPGRFGWHDLWHTMVLAAAGCHFTAVMMVAL